MKPVLVSGIQPTGKLHIGNYLGALKNFVALQNTGKFQCFFFIADLHSMTEEFNPKEKPKQVENLILDFLAAGIDLKKSVLFVQSAISAHSELAWILNTITPFGELRRMTQFKEKSLEELRGKMMARVPRIIEEGIIQDGVEFNPNVGLFDYPVLMAADILLYDAKFVPVGDDQLQHLELARMIARKFNSKFGNTFLEPKPLLTEIPRLMSLDDPTKKMSKSRPEGCLFLDDEPETIRKKIMRAVTDSGTEVHADREQKPAVTNLIRIYSAMSGKSTSQIEERFKGKGYGEFKKELAEIVVQGLVPFQKKKREMGKKRAVIMKQIAIGNKEANAIASKKLAEVKKKIGLR